MHLFIQGLIPPLTVAADALAVFLFAAIFSRRTWGRGIVDWAGKRALWLGLLLSLVTVLGSLFYSNVLGFAPCELCWWQRVSLYPMLALFLVALYKRHRGVFSYVVPLSLLAIIFSAYNTYIQFGGDPLVPCDVNNPCTKLYVFSYGFVTIPIMAATAAVLFLLLAWINKVYEKDSNA